MSGDGNFHQVMSGELVPADVPLSGEVHDRPTVDVTGLAATGLAVGPDEVLVLLVSRYVDERTLLSFRRDIEDALPRDRYLILQGWKLAKVSLEVAAQWQALEADANNGVRQGD